MKPLIAALAVFTAPLSAAPVTLLGFGEIPATARDSLGDTIGGLGSAVAYDPHTGEVLMMPDRGAGDGTIAYRPRYYRLRLTREGRKIHAAVEKTILFRDERGRSFTGLLADRRDAPLRGDQRCLDPEALAVAPDGSLYVSDEYAPALLHFRPDGSLIRVIPLPDWYQPKNAAGSPEYRPRPRLRSGRTENQGAEAMGILPDGQRAVLIMQSALAQDGGRSAGTSRVLILDLRSGRPVAEYAYAFTDPASLNPKGARPRLTFADLSVNDLAVIDARTFLVLERDNLGRSGPRKPTVARHKAVFVVRLDGATNLLDVPGRPFGRAPADPAFRPLARSAGVRFVEKTPLFNLPDLVAQLGLRPADLAAKWEGLARLPSPSRGSFRLLMTADNDFLDPHPRFDGVTHKFPRAKDAVPTQFFEILAKRPPIF